MLLGRRTSSTVGSLELRGAGALVTGASRGIGAEISRHLAAAGVRVALVARESEALRALAQELGGAAVPADLADATDLRALVERSERALGQPIDVLVNNAGVDVTRSIAAVSFEELAKVQAVNLLAPMELCRQVMPGMLERRKGHIVNVCSMAACGAFFGLSAYGATKAGLANFTGILREELRHEPVRFTTVWLGPVPTELLDNARRSDMTRAAFDRFARLGMMPNTPTEKVAAEVVEAVERRYDHVILPARGALYVILNESPRWIISLALSGLTA